MTKKLLSVLLVLTTLFTMSLAIVAEEEVLEAPIPDGSPLFEYERMIKMDEIVNGGVFSEKYQKYRTYAGIQFFPDEYKGEICVRVEPVDGKVTGYFDIGYYNHMEAFGHSLDARKYSWLKVRYAYNEEAADIDCMKFWASKDAPVLGTTIGAAQKIWDIANGNGEWMETVVNLDDLIFEDGSVWNESTVRQIRLYMFEYNETADADCYIAGFGLFETEEEAKAYKFNQPNQPAETTEALTEAPTEAITEAPTEEITEAPTEAVSEAVTEAPTEAVTEELDEEVTEAPAEPITEAITEVKTETATEVVDTTEVSEEVTEDIVSVEVTEIATETATEAPTEAPTEAVTEAPEEEATEEQATEVLESEDEEGMGTGAIVGIIAAVVVVIALVAISIKKKK